MVTTQSESANSRDSVADSSGEGVLRCDWLKMSQQCCSDMIPVRTIRRDVMFLRLLAAAQTRSLFSIDNGLVSTHSCGA